MNKAFCVCYASSDEYAQFTGISLISLLENNTQIIDRVYILSFGISEGNIYKLSSIASSYKIELSVIDALSKMKDVFVGLDMQLFEGSYATYARAFIGKIIDDYYGKLLYIDSDTIVDGSIYPLKEIDLELRGKAYAGVIGMNQYIYPYTEIKMKCGNRRYYACGVLLFDLSMWKKANCTNTIIEYIKNADTAKFIYADQTVINNCINEDLAFPLEIEYNYWGHMFRGKRELYELTRGNFYSPEQVEKAKKRPIIIHYKGFIVHPWLKGNVSNLAKRFHYYKSLSPWRDEKEYSIFYSDEDKKITFKQINIMLKTICFLRRPYFIEHFIETMLEIKHEKRKEE